VVLLLLPFSRELGEVMSMDKADFVRLAPYYYAMAVMSVLRKRGDPFPDYKIRSVYLIDMDNDPEPRTLLDRGVIWERAVSWLIQNGLIKVQHDPFGPPVFSRTTDASLIWDGILKDPQLPFYNFEASGQSDDWLVPALHALENTYVNLEMEPEDFESPEREWEPVPLDLEEVETQEALEQLEAVTKDVREDNGYAVTHPQERDFVLEGLDSTVKKFKEGSVSARYVRVALERLSLLGKRFAGSAKELSITAAKTALMEFAKKHFGDLLNYLWKSLF
jgi:hypothetical protein